MSRKSDLDATDSNSSIIRTAAAYPTEYVYWPAFSLWSALFLMNMSHELPGQTRWVRRTCRALEPDLRDSITLLNDTTILHGIHVRQLALDLTSQEIPELLQWLANTRPQEIAGMLPPVQKISALSTGRARFGMDDPIADWSGLEVDSMQVSRLRSLIDSPEALKEFVIDTVQRFWEEHLAIEFRRLRPHLQDAVASGNRRKEPRTHRELVLELAGREPVGETCHVGSFLLTRHIKDPDSILLVAFESGRERVPDRTTSAEPTASTFRALADETRLDILRLLATGERYGSEIVNHCGLSQPTVSKHLRTLVAEGFLNVRREGGMKFYSINPNRLEQVGDGVGKLGAA
jgi:DNA-binding transcriptional ArsR family regulator